MPESTCGYFFFLQVGVEAEGSGHVWGLDVGSGSGDIVDNEDLLRVSIRGTGAGVGDLGGKIVESGK